MTRDSQVRNAECRRDHGDLIGEAEAVPERVAEANGNPDQMDTEDSTQEMATAQVAQTEAQPQVRHSITHATRSSMIDRRQETAASERQDQPDSANVGNAPPHDNIFATMPQALLGTGMF